MSNKQIYNDRELFLQLVEGNPTAFEQLVDRYTDRVFGHALTFLKDTSKARDVVQEVFFTLWKSRQKLAQVDHPENFLFIIARNKIVSELRKKKSLPLPLDLELMHPSAEALPDHALENKQLVERLQDAINQLPQQRRRVFEMSRKEGLKYAEIAQKLEISPNTVKVHIVQALSFIRLSLIDHAPLLLLFSVM